jgi:hypothetical protein
LKRPIDIAKRCWGWFASALLAFVLPSTAVQAHSASDAYLNLTVDNGSHAGKLVVHGQWDIALRDLDFVLKLDDDGDGRLTWGEVRLHQDAIQRYAYKYLAFSGGPGSACAISPIRQLVDNHADGAYAVLLFDVVCARLPTKLTLGYSMFFAIDPSHRGIFVLQNGTNTATAVLSPQNDRIDLTL